MTTTLTVDVYYFYLEIPGFDNSQKQNRFQPIGPISLATTASFIVTLTNNLGVAFNPSLTPTFRVYDGSTPVFSGTLTKLGSDVGVYSMPLVVTSGNGFASGKTYVTLIQYESDIQGHSMTRTFEVR